VTGSYVPFRMTLPMLLLASILLNAGLTVRGNQAKNIVKNPLPLLGGLVGNLVIPVVLVLALAPLLRSWHSSEETRDLLLGLALVTAMPIAGSSTAWSQHAHADLSLSLGLVLFSTCLSPLTAPIALNALDAIVTRSSSARLTDIASTGAGGFLSACVLVPSLAGLFLRAVLGEARIAPMKPGLRLISAGSLLALNYANGSASLPQTVADPDWDFLVIAVCVVGAVCASTFGAGWLVGRVLHADFAQRTALVFALGMSNNGTGLVLASVAWGDHPRVMLPILLYNVLQQLFAAITTRLVS
jgi:bile acid:Na+ symporter, BASS family